MLFLRNWLFNGSHESFSDNNVSSEEHLCQSDACRAELGLIYVGLNQSADPCHNFYDYVCENFKENHENLDDAYPYVDWDLIASKSFGKEILRVVKNAAIVTNFTSEKQRTYVEYLNHVFDTCMEFYSQNSSAIFQDLRTVVDSLDDATPTELAMQLKRDFMLEGYFSVRVTGASEFPGGPPALVHIETKLPTSYDRIEIEKLWTYAISISPEITHMKNASLYRQKFFELYKKLVNQHVHKNDLESANSVFFGAFEKLDSYPNQNVSAGLLQLSRKIISKNTMIRFKYDVFYLDALLARYGPTARLLIVAQLYSHLAAIESPSDVSDEFGNFNLYPSKRPLNKEDKCLNLLTISPLALIVGKLLINNGFGLPIEQRMRVRRLIGEMKYQLKKSIFEHFVEQDLTAMIGITEGFFKKSLNAYVQV